MDRMDSRLMERGTDGGSQGLGEGMSGGKSD